MFLLCDTPKRAPLEITSSLFAALGQAEELTPEIACAKVRREASSGFQVFNSPRYARGPYGECEIARRTTPTHIIIGIYY